MKGLIGRYTFNLVNAQEKNIEIFIAIITKKNMIITSGNNFRTLTKKWDLLRF
jgi:hypothetical protein